MKAVLLYGAKDIRLEDRPLPAVGPQDVLIKISACGICGSDASFYRMGSFYGAETPMPLGHELTGIVVSTGSAVKNVQTGARVVVDPMMGSSTIGCGDAEQGAFAEYVRIPVTSTTQNLFHLPDELSSEIAALCEPIAVASHAVNSAAPKANERVVIFGAGPIGLGAVVRLYYLGIKDISVIDFSELRLGIARQLGATRTFNPTQGKTSRFLREQCGTRDSEGGSGIDADVFIDAAGAGAALQEMIKLAPHRARIVVVAMHTKPVEIDMTAVMSKELRIIGSMGYPQEFADVVDMVKKLNTKLLPMITHRFPLKDFHAAFEMSMDAQQAAKVMVTMDE